MVEINPASLPNQEFEAFIDGVQYTFRLHLFRDMLYADVSIDGEVIARSVRCIDRTWLYPVHKKDMAGNFRFESKYKGEYPNYEKFGDTCQLVFYSNAEIEELEGSEE